MNQYKAFKYRLYPTDEQKVQLAKNFGCKRFIYNYYLNLQQERFKNNEKHLSRFDINKDITTLKKEKEWLKEVDSVSLQQVAEDLNVAFNNFFKSITGKRKGSKVAVPKFKSKHSKQSYRTAKVKIGLNEVIVPKIKSIKAVIHQKIPDDAKIKSATISKNTDGRYYASILIEVDVPLINMTGNEVGCDLGLKDLLILSNGIKFKRPNNLKYIARTKQLLKQRQKQFARTIKGSKNQEKERLKVARTYSKINRQRNDYYHCISKFLVYNYDSIYVEDLAVKNMLKNKKLSRVIHESAWSTLSSMIAYKSMWYGKTYHKIDRYYASSKTCSSCGYKLEQLDLATRNWVCPSCGSNHDRDHNAAINILHEGQYDLYETSQATDEVELNIPRALMKFVDKIERSDDGLPVSKRIKQTKQSCGLRSS